MNPENNDVCHLEEFDIIKEWAEINRMHLNLAKTKEIVFHRPNKSILFPTSSILFPTSSTYSPLLRSYSPLLDSLERITEAKLLGVFLRYNINFETLVKFILTQCCQQIHLKLLKDQGLALLIVIMYFKGRVFLG